MKAIFNNRFARIKMKNSNFLYVPLLGLLLASGACNNDQQESAQQQVERPREAWVVRSVLDQKPRMLSVALNEKLWLAYNTQTASLYKAWVGGISFEGAVYTAAHGPQPTTLGTPYMIEPDGNLWKIVSNGSEVTPDVNFKGHVIRDNQVTLKYELVYNGQTIEVEEKPEFFQVEGEEVGLERVFTTSGVPEGVQVALDMNLASLKSEEDFETDGTFKVEKKEQEQIEGKEYLKVSGTLLLNSNDKTQISIELAPKPDVAVAAGQLDGEEKVLSLMAKSDCNTCHNVDVKTVGPAYVDVAERYPTTPEVTDQLVAKIIEGGAGSWGDVPMTPHPDLSEEDARTMVSYILSLDGEEEAAQADNKLMPKPDFEIEFQPVKPGEMSAGEEREGIALNAYQFAEGFSDFPEINDEMLPVVSGSINALHAGERGFGGLSENFVLHATGNINVEKNTNVVFRLVSDDGSRLFVNNELVVDNGGNHGLVAREGEIILKEGKNPFKIEYFQGGGGKGLSLQWAPYGSEEFTVVPPSVFTFTGADIKRTQDAPLAATANENKGLTPGDGVPLADVHPSFDLAQARPDDFQPKVGGMDFLPDGRLVISTWDSLGSVYILDGVQGKNPGDIQVKRIAFGLAEPLGLKVVDGEIYVLQKQELTKLIDHDQDDIIDEYETVANGWKVSANFHEFAFGLLYKDGYFYGTLATAINPGGASTQPQIPDRGKVLKISKEDGSYELIASGLRTPNGIGFGVDNEIYIADNQGDWLPASKIVHLQEGAWYGSRSVDFEGTANLTETLPVVWLPQDEIGNSPSQPARLDVGPYQNQMIHGEVTHGGIKRVFAEKIDGEYQGVVFRFIQGLEAGINRLVWGPDGALYAGGVGSTGNWNQAGKEHFGLQRLTYNGTPVFEMLAVRAKPNGVEIEFTEPLKEGSGTKASDYNVRQWWYKPTEEYGGPKLDEEALKIRSVKVSDDRKKVFLELPGMKEKHMVYIRLNKDKINSESGRDLWTTEAWYTMNNIPNEATASR